MYGVWLDAVSRQERGEKAADKARWLNEHAY